MRGLKLSNGKWGREEVSMQNEVAVKEWFSHQNSQIQIFKFRQVRWCIWLEEAPD